MEIQQIVETTLIYLSAIAAIIYTIEQIASSTIEKNFFWALIVLGWTYGFYISRPKFLQSTKTDKNPYFTYWHKTSYDVINTEVKRKLHRGGDSYVLRFLKENGIEEPYFGRAVCQVIPLTILGIIVLMTLCKHMFWTVIACGCIMFVETAFFSGILHLVLDNPGNITHPFWKILLEEPALEFQLHHEFQKDNVHRGWLNMCGDISMTVVWHGGAYCVLTYFLEPSHSRKMCIVACLVFKLLFAYFGQWTHMESHRIPEHQSWAYKLLSEKMGIAMTRDFHKKHHANHDKNFCLLNGWPEPLVALLYRTVHPQLLNCFFISLFFDAFVISGVVDKIAFGK